MTETTTPALPEGFVQAEWVCTGRAVMHGGGQGVGFRDQASGERSAFKMTPKLKRYRAGGVYRVQASATSARFDDAHRAFVRLHDDAAERREWQLREEALEVESRLDRAYKRAFEETDDVRAALAPLRSIYHARDRVGRLALEVVLLQHLRNPLA
jgi:hypothetical protein